MPQRYIPTPAELAARLVENNSVPAGHRAKCRTCGAVDNVVYKGFDRRRGRCGACGSSIARRRAPKKPNIISFVVCKQLNGDPYGETQCVDLNTATNDAVSFCERGPVARVRVAQIVEMLDDSWTGNVRTLRYDNFRQKRSTSSWVGGCVACKGRGLVAVTIRPAFGGEKAIIKFLPCVSCNGLGGELTRRVMFGKGLR